MKMSQILHYGWPLAEQAQQDAIVVAGKGCALCHVRTPPPLLLKPLSRYTRVSSCNLHQKKIYMTT